MTNTYHCYQPVGRMALATHDTWRVRKGEPLLVIVADHNDGDIHYGVIGLFHPHKQIFRKKTDDNYTVLPGYEQVDYFYLRPTSLEFFGSDATEGLHD